MSNLTRFENDGIELVIDTRTGEAFATMRGYSRMSGKAISTISERMSKGVRLEETLEVEIETPGGLQGVRLIPAKLVFKWLMKDNPDLAEAMGEAGATVYLHQLAGFKVSSTATEVKPEPEQPKLGSSVEATISALNAFRQIFQTVPEALVEGMILNEVQVHHPEFKDFINKGHSLLAANTPIDEILLNPTAIGERLGTKAQTVNMLLREHGYQVKNESKKKGEPAYFPTEKGKQYSSNTIATGKNGNNGTFQHIKWYESIIDELRAVM